MTGASMPSNSLENPTNGHLAPINVVFSQSHKRIVSNLEASQMDEETAIIT